MLCAVAHPASKLSLNEYLDRWLSDWARSNLSPKSSERYAELLRLHVRPTFGHLALQKLEPLALQEHYGRLLREPRKTVRNGRPITYSPLHPRTIGHLHRVLRRALAQAVAWRLAPLNPLSDVKPPRVEDREMEIIRADQLPDALARLAGDPLHPIVVLALASGCRRGELAALRWRDVDMTGNRDGKLHVMRSLEQTKEGGLRFKPCKTKAGRRRITIASAAVAALRTHRLALLEQRMALGLGALAPDDLVFPQADGTPQRPNSISTAWIKV